MKSRKFLPPNFICVTVDQGGNVTARRLERAVSEEALATRLRLKGLTVKSIKPFDFERWQAAARRETEQVIARRKAGRTVVFKPRIWSMLRDYLFWLCDGECAYCEGRPQAVSWGDVEHFRPKKAVHEDPGHPGYYWLAYDVTNLLPCCTTCNQARAKMTHFPLPADGVRATDPRHDLTREKPLLLNPFLQDPRGHLAFTPPTAGTYPGTVAGRTPEGEASVTFYNLNREWLCTERATAQEDAIIRLDRQLAKDAAAVAAALDAAIVRQEGVYGAARAAAAEFWRACMAAIFGPRN